MNKTTLAIFRGKTIRKTLFQKEWWFSVVDICGILTDSPDPGAYWRKLKQRLIEEGSEVVTFCHGLEQEWIFALHQYQLCDESIIRKKRFFYG